MFTKTIKYTDYEGNERTRECRFHLSKADLIEMNFSAAGGMERGGWGGNVHPGGEQGKYRRCPGGKIPGGPGGPGADPGAAGGSAPGP